MWFNILMMFSSSFAPPSNTLAESRGLDHLNGSLPLHTTSQSPHLLRSVPGLVALGRKTPCHLTLILTSKVTSIV